ncbi:MAG TPA: ribosome biogenesis GTPase Der [Xanthobacteraceae bacterium]|jgi:GTP-binding protein
MSFTVAIVGRPNVGKSTLFNRLVGKRLALVDDTPGVTRDRREGEAHLGDLDFRVFDTAGLDKAAPDTLSGRMRQQTEAAIAAADIVLFLIDARAGPLPADHSFADVVRRSAKRAILVANKSESRAAEAGFLQAFELGLGEPVAISAEHGEGLADLYAALRATLPAETERTDRLSRRVAGTGPSAPKAPIRIAVMGRPNSGKSTLVNRILGEERLVTGAEPGTTRDAIGVDVEWHGRKLRLHDTAGLRRRSRIEQRLEKLSVTDALNALRFAEVVILLLDAQKPFEEQDLRIADLVEREGRALVIGINKWDLIEPRPGAIKKLREEADHWLPQLRGVPVVPISGLTGQGLEPLMQAVSDAHAVWNRRAETSALNRWLGEVVATHPPPAVAGRRIRLDYITQPKSRPPAFVLFTSRADAVPDAYRRYLINGLRDSFDLPGTPIRLTLREKKNPYARRKPLQRSRTRARMP